MNETRKWILHRVTAIILAPLYVWLYFSLVSLYTKNYLEATYFFSNSFFFELKTPIFIYFNSNSTPTTWIIRLWSENNH